MHVHAHTRTAITPPGSRAVRLALSLTIIASLVAAPLPAFANSLAGDQVVSAPISASGLASSAPNINAASAVVMGPDGRILWSRDATGRRAQASTTKVMTGLLVLENADLDASVYISPAAAAVPYAHGLVAGELRSVRELLELALVVSSNDAAHALAEHVGGSESGFVAMMNERARELGLADTHFANPHGLDAAGHYSSAKDIAALSMVAMKEPEFRRIVALPAVPLPGWGTRPPQTLPSTDRKLGTVGRMLGIKTGFTDDAKYCLVAASERNRVAFTAVVLGAPNSQVRFQETTELLNWAFDHFRYETVASEGETVFSLPVTGSERTVQLAFASSVTAPVFYPGDKVAREITAPDSVDLPVFKGQRLGEAKLTQAGGLLATVPLIAAESIASAREIVGAVSVSGYADREVAARAAAGPLDVPEFDPSVGIERTVSLASSVRAPVREGDQVGVITYTANGEVVVVVPAVAAESVEAPDALQRTRAWFVRVWQVATGRSSATHTDVALTREWTTQRS